MKRRSWWMALFAPQTVAQQVLDKAGSGEFVPTRPKIEAGSGQEYLLLAQAMAKLQNDQHKLLAVQSKIAEVLAGQQRMLDAINRDIYDKPKPEKNQCPVCGTLAPERTDQKVRDKFGAPFAFRLPGGSEVECWLTRCAHCNAAFWQDGKEAGNA